MKFTIRQSIRNPERGCYILVYEDVEEHKHHARFVWKDLELHVGTGYNSDCKYPGDAPGYYRNRLWAKYYLEAYLTKGIKMNYKVGDKVKVKDRSYSFGIKDGKYSSGVPIREPVTIIKTDLSVMRNADRDRSGQYTTVCDLLVTDRKGGYWFTQSRFCEPVDKKIEVRYFCDGQDVTNSISDETKRNLGG